MNSPERSVFEKIANPHDLEHPALVGLAIGAVSAYAAGVVISGWLHRSTHGGVEYSEGTKKLWRGANWFLTGMPKAEWSDHLVHHAYPDREDHQAQDDWNANRPTGAPEAPIEAFRDPYSGIQEGYLTVLFNTSGLHRRAKKKIMPFLYGLHEFDQESGAQTRDHWPTHLRRVDMEEANPQALRNKYPFAGLILKGTVETVLFGPAVSAVSIPTHIVSMLYMGGDINAVKHTGQKQGFRNRIRVLLGKDEPVPNSRGEFAADMNKGYEALVLGEPSHERHHNNPEDPYLVGNNNLLRDPVGFLISKLVKFNLATTPGANK